MEGTIAEPTLGSQRKLCNIWIELFPIDQGVTSGCVFETVWSFQGNKEWEIELYLVSLKKTTVTPCKLPSCFLGFPVLKELTSCSSVLASLSSVGFEFCLLPLRIIMSPTNSKFFSLLFALCFTACKKFTGWELHWKTSVWSGLMRQ